MKTLGMHTSNLGSAIVMGAWRRDAMNAVGMVDPITGMRIVPRDPFTCFVGDDGDEGEGGEGGEGKPGKTFTQDELDRIVKTRLKKQERELAEATKRADAATKASEETAKKLEALQAKLDESGKSDIEKELGKVQRDLARLQDQNAKLAAEHAEALKKATEAQNGLTTTKLETTLREALRANKAHGKGMDQAVRLMLAEGAAFDEEGGFQMKVGDVPFEKPEEAAKKWLETNPHFVEGSGGGSGTPRNGSGKLTTTAQMDTMSTGALIATGLNTKPGSPAE